jgi:hypothetical protein
VTDVGAVHNGNIGGNHLDTTLTNFMFGPRFRVANSRVRPYFNVLFGGMHASTSIAVNAIPVPPSPTQPIYLPGQTTPLPDNSPVTARAIHAQTAFAMTAGGGLDIKINRHVSFRPIGLDYLLTRLQNLRTANDNNQHSLRYTTGFNFTFGGEAPSVAVAPPPPPMKACWDGSSVNMSSDCPKRNMDLRTTAAAMELCPGTSMNIAVPGTPPPGAAFEWTVNGEPISKDPAIEFGTTGREPGTYKVGLNVSAPDYNPASLERTVTIGSYRPPSGGLEVSPREIWAGDKATVSANFTSGNCGGRLGAPALSASEGAISGNVFDSTEVRFDPNVATEQRKTVTLMAKVADEKGEGSAQAMVIVKKPAGVVAKRYPDIVFPAGNSRVNNCGKRVLLEDLKTAIEGDPTGKVILIGHVSAKEASRTGLDQQRALNSAAVLSAGKGICYSMAASQIMVGAVGATDTGVDYQSKFCGTTNELPGSRVSESETEARERRVEVWFLPTGGVLPASVKDVKDAASLTVATLGCPR